MVQKPFDADNKLEFKLRPYLGFIPSSDQADFLREDSSQRMKCLDEVRLLHSEKLMRSSDLKQRATVLWKIRIAASMRLLLPEYRSWLARRVVRYRLGTHERWWTLGSKTVAIDVSVGLPPKEIVIKLLQRRKNLVFFSKSPQRLLNALESIKGGIDRTSEDGRAAFDLWDKAVSWACAEQCFDPNIISCKFFR